MEFLFQYGLFAAKAATVVVAVGLVVLIVVAARRGGGKGDGLTVTHLNRRYEELGASLERVVLPKKAYKAKHKAAQRTRKADEKARAAQAKAAAKGGTEKAGDPDEKRRVYVIDFHGDLRASGVDALREEVTAILTLARPQDEVLVRIENAGGMVHGHGLAASQLARIRDREIPLTAAVDKVAASGGYMMACVASRIIAAPFALVGSIGVLAQLPNFNRLLDRHGIDFELIKAGEHKRSLTVFGKNTDEDRAKMQHDIDQVHALFKGFVARYRPRLDIEAVATGEHWFGTEAHDLALVDELVTSDDYLFEAAKDADLYAVAYHRKQGLGQRLAALMSGAVDRASGRLSGF